MADTNADTPVVDIVVAERPIKAGTIAGVFGGAMKLPAAKPGMNMLRVIKNGSTHEFLVGAPGDGERSMPDVVLFVRAEPWPVNLVVAGVKPDPEGHAWDLKFGGMWKVTGPAQFAQQYAANVVSPGASLDASDVQSWALGQIRHRVLTVVEDLALDDLKRGVRSNHWWDLRLNEWFAPMGLTIAGTDAELYSATAANAEEQRKQDQHEREVQARRTALREQEIAEQAAEAQFEQRKAEIETNQQLAADQRTAQLEELERQRQARKDQAEKAQLEAAQDLERLRYSHEIAMAEMGRKVAEQRIQRQKEDDARFVDARELAKLKQTEQLQKLQAQRERLSADVEAGRYRVAAEKAEMQRKLVELESAEKAVQGELSRQEVERNLKTTQANLRLQQLEAEHQQTMAAADAFGAARQAMLVRQAQECGEHEARLARQRESQSEALHSAKMQRIRADATLSEDVRLTQIKVEQQNLETARQRAARESDDARVKAEREKVLYEEELKCTRLKYRIFEAALNVTTGIDQRLASYLAAMVAAERQIPETVADLMGADRFKAHQAAETITQQWHTPMASLQSLGYAVTAQSLVDRWKRKAEGDGSPVQLDKRELIMRDMGVSSSKVLRIGACLNFSIRSRRAGCITVINLGTSGRFWLLCPGLCAVQQARVEANRVYQLPGRELFPYDDGDLQEQGPVGYEHLVAIVSDRPLIDAAWLSGGKGIINEIQSADLERVVARLDKTPSQWSAGVLSFKVEK